MRAELTYIEKRGYPVSYVEMGEEPDGAYMMPEDYAALYVQWAKALHKVDPKLKLGGPVFTGVNKESACGPTPGPQFMAGPLPRLPESAWRPRGSCVRVVRALSAGSVRRSTGLTCSASLDSSRRHSTRGGKMEFPRMCPLFNTESNVSWSLTDPMQDIFSALWLADSVGAFLTDAGPGAAYYHSPGATGAIASRVPRLEYVWELRGR